MRASVSGKVQVKATRGVRTLAAALEMIDAGVTRMWAKAIATILEDFTKIGRMGDEVVEVKPPCEY